MESQTQGTEAGIRGLFASLKALLSTLLELLRVRLELLTTEIEEAKVRFLRTLAMLVLGLFLLCLGLVVAVFLVAAAFWDSHRLLVLGGMAVLFLGSGLALLAAARRAAVSGPRLLASTLGELERDRRGLGGK